MKDAAPLPTVMLFGGTTDEQSRMAAALATHFECLPATSIDAAKLLMKDNFVQVLISVEDTEDTTHLDQLCTEWPETMVVRVSDQSDVGRPDMALVPRNWTPGPLKQAVSVAATTFRLTRENQRMELEMRCLSAPRAKPIRQPDLGFETVLRTPDSAMASIITMARQYATFDVPVMLLGEVGTGKGNLARAIHDSSLRSDGPFETLDLAGMTQEAATVALFGQRSRAANGGPSKPGLLQKANFGSLYLSGVETLPRPLQHRLHRFLQDGLFERVGDTQTETSNARLIASLTGDPQTLIEQGALDSAFYYGLSIAELTLPPLRTRKSDIPLLAQAAAETAARIYRKGVQGISETAMDFLSNYDWPGNLRELENEVVRMLILSQAPVLGPEVISRRILQAAPGPDPAQDDTTVMTGIGTLKDRVEEIEARILRETLTRLGWNKSRSAAELGLSRVGLRAKLDRYGIIQPHQIEEEA